MNFFLVSSSEFLIKIQKFIPNMKNSLRKIFHYHQDKVFPALRLKFKETISPKIPNRETEKKTQITRKRFFPLSSHEDQIYIMREFSKKKREGEENLLKEGIFVLHVTQMRTTLYTPLRCVLSLGVYNLCRRGWKTHVSHSRSTGPRVGLHCPPVYICLLFFPPWSTFI